MATAAVVIQRFDWAGCPRWLNTRLAARAAYWLTGVSTHGLSSRAVVRVAVRLLTWQLASPGANIPKNQPSLRSYMWLYWLKQLQFHSHSSEGGRDPHSWWVEYQKNCSHWQTKDKQVATVLFSIPKTSLSTFLWMLIKFMTNSEHPDFHLVVRSSFSPAPPCHICLPFLSIWTNHLWYLSFVFKNFLADLFLTS